MTAYGARLKLRLFLEGVEIPVVAANIMSQKNAAASCSIQIPANDYALDLKPRTLVHLFCYDGYKGAPPESQVWVQGENITIKRKLAEDPDKEGMIPKEGAADTAKLSAIDLENMNYKLIFGGEVVAVQYQKSPTSRGINLQCVDWSSYWDIAYQYQVSGMSLGFGNLNQAFTGASTTVFNEFLKTSGDIVLELLSSAPRSYPEMKNSLLGGLMHIIEAIGGCYFGPNAIKGTNDFFSIAEMRLHLTQMIGANPRSATDELRLMRANGFGSLFGKTLGGLGQLVTIRQVLLALQRYIFHEIIPITAPRYVPAKSSPELGQTETVPLNQDPKTAVLAKSAARIKQKVLQLKAAQQRATNISVGGSMTDFHSITRAADEAYRRTKKAAAETGANTAGLEQVATAFETARAQIGTAGKQVQAKGSETYEFPPMDTGAATRMIGLFDSAIKAMERVLRATYRRPSQGASHQPHPPPRLITQVYRPDVWMVAPPRCNVLFPELYSSFSYGRNFLNECTRLLLRTHEAFYGSDFLFDGFYMAPSRILGARQQKHMGRGRMDYEPPDLSDAPAAVLKDMMDHELYTGISPVFERMSDLNLHALRGGAINIDNTKVGYAQLTVNHLFFMYRFRSRELSVSGKFNPYAVLGFPAVVIDKYISDDKMRGGYDSVLAKRLAQSFANLPPIERQNIVEVSAAKVDELAASSMQERDATHYLGTPEMIAHSISANAGGQTQYQMGYARTTTEKTEFFGDALGRSAKAKKTRTQRRDSVIASRTAPSLGSVGTYGGKIVAVTNVTSQYQRAQPKKDKQGNRHASTRTLPLFEGDRFSDGRKNRATRVPVGVTKPAMDYGAEVIAIVGSGGADIAADDRGMQVRFEAWKIVEEVSQYTVYDKRLPPEQLLFPPWYGEDWRTHKVGALYSDFFGVGAITDPTVVLSGGVERKFGEGDPERTLHLDIQSVFETVLGPEQHPPAGMSQVPEMSGGGVLGTNNEGDPQVLGEVKARSPIAEAIGEIVKVYSATRQHHFDTPSFVHNYTWRPIATIVDIFGTSDLYINERGVVMSGREGFHSRAFGDYDDLRQLVTNDEWGPQKILGIKAAPGELSSDEPDAGKKVAERLDTRKEKQRAVFRYLTALAASRGVLLG